MEDATRRVAVSLWYMAIRFRLAHAKNSSPMSNGKVWMSKVKGLVVSYGEPVMMEVKAS
jgi:hypothetical protein